MCSRQPEAILKISHSLIGHSSRRTDMCRRFTYNLTWPEIVKLYRLSLDAPARNTQPRYNICPTTTIDTLIGRMGARALVPMRWGLIPSWWSQPLKEMKLATFNARVETVTEKPMFRKAFSATDDTLTTRSLTTQ
jgi:putative SOS response-associated peptidase YedK